MSWTAFDANGDGVADMHGLDTDYDGDVELVQLDLNQDGYVDGVMVDYNGDGVLETVGIDNNQNGYYETVGVDNNADGWYDAIGNDMNENGIFDHEEASSSIYLPTTVGGPATYDGLGGALLGMAAASGSPTYGTGDRDGDQISDDRDWNPDNKYLP